VALNDSASLLFKIKAENGDAVRALKEVRTETAGLETQAAGLGTSFSSLAGPAAIAAAAIAGIAAVGIGAAKSLFDLTKQASEYGSEIYDASQKTGLGAKELSALKFAADQAGSSFEQVTKGIVVFGSEVGKAAEGDDKAAEKMKRLGVTSTDLHTALSQVFKTISEGRTDTEKLSLATEAFGRRIGPDLIPLIKDANGNFEELIKKAEDLGVTLSDKDAAAADQFGDQMDLLKAQIGGVARQIGFEFMPIFLRMAQGLSGFVKDNRSEISVWASDVRIALEDVIRGFGRVIQFVKDNETWIRAILAVGTFGASEAAIGAIKSFGSALEQQRQREEQNARHQSQEGGTSTGTLPDTDTDTETGKTRKSHVINVPGKNNQADADRTAARGLAADIRIEIGNLDQQRDAMVAAIEKIRKAFTESGDVNNIDQFAKQVGDEFKNWNQSLQSTLKYLDETERRALKNATPSEQAALEQKQQQRRDEFVKLGIKLQEQNVEAVEKVREATIEGERDKGAEVIKTNQAIQAQIDAWDKMVPVITNVGDELREQVFKDLPEDDSPFAAWTGSFKDFVDAVMDDGPTISETLNDIANTMADAFEGVADAIGHVVENWVLYGKTGPAIMRQILAEALASIAAEAAVKAIYQLAEGFAALFFNPAEAAAHFTAAALYGSIAVGAAVAGRAVAGNSFNKQTAKATGSPAGAAASQGTRGGSANPVRSIPRSTVTTQRY
jgi:hypothetical protein